VQHLKTYKLKQILFGILWLLLAIAAIVLLVAAINKKEEKKCKSIEIELKGKGNNFFVEEADVLAMMTTLQTNEIVGSPIHTINIRLLESELEKSIWIKKAELFFDNNEVLKVSIEEREPIARLFSTSGTSFYIDSMLFKLPLSDKYSAKVPVFTGFPSDKTILSELDSIILKQVKRLSMAIQKDSFHTAMIEQIDITPQLTFEFIPKIGNQLILFGTATDIDAKLYKLKLFYKNVMANESWNKYSTINLQYANQIIAKRRGAEDVTADSLKAIQLMQQIATIAEKQASDSLQTILLDNSNNTTDSTIIQQSIERDEEEVVAGSNTIEEPILAKPLNAKPQAVVAKPPTPKPMPKIVKLNPAKPIVKPKQPVKKN
jgi:cell division protein FtsQ